ncbi:MAG: CDP-alcohol phosphatidyltransferase family protein [Myxococcota bacterium]
MTPAEAAKTPVGRQLLAWGVHALTASGAVIGVMALVWASTGQLERAALCMLATMFIDSVDGTLARAVGVARVTPGIDGRRLDDIVDYFNFAIVPVAFMVWSGHLPGGSLGDGATWLWVAPPLLASAYGFSQVDAKTEDDYFLGWPSYWNVVALYLWLLDLSPAAGGAWVLLFSAAIFVPLKYIYPSKLRVLRTTTTVLGLAWGSLLIAAVLWPDREGARLMARLSLAYIVYYLALSGWLGRWWRPRDPD